MDIFYRVFSNEVLPIKLIRNLGLGLAERILPAKNKVMRSAMGFGGQFAQACSRRTNHLIRKNL